MSKIGLIYLFWPNTTCFTIKVCCSHIILYTKLYSTLLHVYICEFSKCRSIIFFKNWYISCKTVSDDVIKREQMNMTNIKIRKKSSFKIKLNDFFSILYFHTVCIRRNAILNPFFIGISFIPNTKVYISLQYNLFVASHLTLTLDCVFPNLSIMKAN